MPSTSNSSQATVTSRWRKKQWFGGTLTIDENGPITDSVQTFSSVSRSWVRTPNFWILRRSGGLLPENGYQFQSWRYPEGVFNYYGLQSGGGYQTARWITRPKVQLCRDPSHGVTLPLSDLYSRLVDRARRSDFSLPVAMVEGRQTVQMVAQTASTLARVISNLRRGNLVAAYGALQIEPSRSQVRRFNDRFGVNPRTTAANYWLQSQYGWIPLLHDVKNAAEALAIAVNSNELMTTSVRASTRLRAGRTWPNQIMEWSPRYVGETIATVELSRRAVWRFRPNAADLPGLFGLVNPAQVVWEIIPFSFVADWFIPIGDYLTALDVPLRFVHVGGSHGFREKVVWVTTPHWGQYPDGYDPVPSQGTESGSIEKIFVERTPITTHPTPTLESLTFEAHLNARRAVSAIALLLQQASRL